ncbi:hypothetical protein [Pseudomonas sp. MEJ086]|uniref:hypothetical protein n=1 Tax=Pseudomonas sp. MEJ086 TaxID=3040319 RepID=UPI0025542F4E|nr:hypothetical protein [Pseudomonas sp. MEJ086]
MSHRRHGSFRRTWDRPAEALRVLDLGELTPDMVDMRTLVIIGSSQTRRFPRGDGGEWVYTPRSYPQS